MEPHGLHWHLLTTGHVTVWLAVAKKTASALLVADLAIMKSSIYTVIKRSAQNAQKTNMSHAVGNNNN